MIRVRSCATSGKPTNLISYTECVTTDIKYEIITRSDCGVITLHTLERKDEPDDVQLFSSLFFFFFFSLSSSSLSKALHFLFFLGLLWQCVTNTFLVIYFF